MASRLIDRRHLELVLDEIAGLPAILEAPAFAEHSRETAAAMLDTAYAIATERFLPAARLGDEIEPRLVEGRVELPAATGAALRAFAVAGFPGALAPAEEGGLGLPFTLHMATSAVFSAASIATMAYAFLTIAAANVIRNFGSAEQRRRYLPPLLDGRWFGTMALTEPQAGSSLADIRTVATPQPDGSYRLRGQKIYISGGEHELSANIVHLVLARTPGAPAGVKGISLFIVPKYLVDPAGQPGRRNEVACAGLFHKLGYRGTSSTILSMGEGDGALAELVGERHRGLAYMFMMMNEARITVGNGAAALGCRGYLESLAYARERPQGRHPDAKDPASPPVPIVEHADVRRMLLTQKALAEGALALNLWAASLVDRAHAATEEADRRAARLLLDLVTPIAKAWPSRWCVQANDLAIQVLGGAGYTRDYPVEQIWRDNRLNPIHEGTDGIQALDLLGRKVPAEGGRGLALLLREIRTAIGTAPPALREEAAALDRAATGLQGVSARLVAAMDEAGPRAALANASVYLDALGHLIVAWLWLRLAGAAERRGAEATSAELRAFYAGQRHAARYFARWELPKLELWLERLAALDDSWLGVPPECL
jgi:alkylation response protein AidB-like acyl-CoA dehydrogenase